MIWLVTSKMPLSCVKRAVLHGTTEAQSKSPGSSNQSSERFVFVKRDIGFWSNFNCQTL